MIRPLVALVSLAVLVSAGVDTKSANARNDGIQFAVSALSSPPRSEGFLASLGVQTTGDTAKECCKICTVGKACGDTCIARDKVCHQPPGCACDG